MKANELMTGDLVIIKDLKDPYKRLSGIDEYRGKVEFWYGEKLIVTSIDNVLPIPLTKEILEKNGFERSETLTDSLFEYLMRGPALVGWEIRHQAFSITDKRSAFVRFIRYVHELQHALRTMGIDNEIKL